MTSINYTVEEIPESVKSGQPPSTIKIVLKQGYKNPRHINRVYNETFDSRRDLFSAYINEKHPDEKLRGKSMYLTRIGLNSLSLTPCQGVYLTGQGVERIIFL